MKTEEKYIRDREVIYAACRAFGWLTSVAEEIDLDSATSRERLLVKGVAKWREEWAALNILPTDVMFMPAPVEPKPALVADHFDVGEKVDVRRPGRGWDRAIVVAHVKHGTAEGCTVETPIEMFWAPINDMRKINPLKLQKGQLT